MCIMFRPWSSSSGGGGCHENVSGIIIVHDIIMKYIAYHNCAGHN